MKTPNKKVDSTSKAHDSESDLDDDPIEKKTIDEDDDNFDEPLDDLGFEELDELEDDDDEF